MTTQAKQPSFDAPASEWLVYADALQEAHDPRGELIVLNHAVEAGKTSAAERDAYVAKNVDALIGKGVNAESYRFGWKHGLIETAEILVEDPAAADGAIDALFAAPSATHLRSVSLVGVSKNKATVDLTGATAKLAAVLPATCKTVGFIDERAAKATLLSSRDFDPDPNLVRFGDLNPFFTNANVESVTISAADSEQLNLGAISAPKLKSFTLNSLRYGVDPYNDTEVALSNSLASSSWPSLESFELRLTETWMANIVDDADAYVSHYAGEENFEDRMDEAEDEGDNEGVNWSQLRALLESLKKTQLKRLALTSVDSASSLLDLIAEVGLPPTLEVLDLSDGSVDNAAWFVNNKKLFAPLKRLVLERTSMTDDDAKDLTALGIEIRHSHSSNGARYRYIVGSE